jgi:hypothetical protein
MAFFEWTGESIRRGSLGVAGYLGGHIMHVSMEVIKVSNALVEVIKHTNFDMNLVVSFDKGEAKAKDEDEGIDIITGRVCVGYV